MQYQTLRSVSDNHVFVICYDGSLTSCPITSAIRVHGRECGAGRSTSSRRTAAGALARDGYALVKCELAVFNPEA
jgi:hypothetical protein